MYGGNILETKLLMQLHRLQDSSISNVKNEKYYVNTDRISVSEEGIYLYSDYFGPIAMKHLLQDNEGVYVMGVFDYYRCNSCGRIYSSPPTKCDSCGGTSFSVVDLFPD